jgi:hypothetical protein
MARIDDLPADQQAVLRLLLTQDRSYDEIARSLRMAPAAVRDRAHDALSALGPRDTPLSSGRRAELADWLLGQQSTSDAARTAEALSASPAAAAWARVVRGALKPLADGDRLPQLPPPDGSTDLADEDGEVSGGSAAAAERARERAGARAAARPSSRRGGAILLAVLALLLTGAAGFVLGRVTAGDDDQPATARDAGQTTPKILGQANLRPVRGSRAPRALGIAQFIERDGQRLINVLAEGLPRTPQGSGYGVWMTGPGRDPLWLGYFQAVTTGGQAGAQSTLKVDPADYRQVLITRQQGRSPKTPGTTYLAGAIRLRGS